MTFGEKLHNLRKIKGMSQEILANELNVSRQAISKWELNTAYPDTENVIKIAKIFKVSTDYLLLDEVIKNENENKKSFWEVSGIYIKKYGYRLGYLVSLISGYFFIGYIIYSLSLMKFLTPIEGFTGTMPFDSTMKTILVFHILTSAFITILGIVVAKHYKKKTKIYRDSDGELK